MNRLKPCVLLVIFFFSCSKAPEGIIPKDRMTSVLEDVHLANSYAANYGDLDTIKHRTSTYLNAIYKKHHIDSVIFNKSLKYYSANPTLLNEIYLQVEKDLSRLQDSIVKAEETDRIRIAAEAKRKQKQDSVLNLRKTIVGRDTVVLKPVIPSLWTSFDGYQGFIGVDSLKMDRNKNKK